MSLIETINTDIKKAMLAKEAMKLKALRAVKAALLLEQTKDGTGSISEDTEIKLLQKLVKQRKDSAEIYKTNGREETANEELQEAEIISSFLPKQLSPEELNKAVQDITTRLGASSMADMGKVMGIASSELQGKAEGKAIANIVRQLLS